ncbi:MAG: type II toxin-antitoxin system VapC family toxin [Calditrichia bacterium]
MILVDSSVWIDYFNGKESWQTDYLDNSLGGKIISIGDLMLAEVLQGFANDKHYTQAREALLIIPCLPICSKAVALKSANNYRILRTNGITVRKTIDMLIATFCIEQELSLLHADKDFDYIGSFLPLQIIKAI